MITVIMILLYCICCSRSQSDHGYSSNWTDSYGSGVPYGNPERGCTQYYSTTVLTNAALCKINCLALTALLRQLGSRSSRALKSAADVLMLHRSPVNTVLSTFGQDCNLVLRVVPFIITVNVTSRP